MGTPEQGFDKILHQRVDDGWVIGLLHDVESDHPTVEIDWLRDKDRSYRAKLPADSAVLVAKRLLWMAERRVVDTVLKARPHCTTKGMSYTIFLNSYIALCLPGLPKSTYKRRRPQPGDVISIAMTPGLIGGYHVVHYRGQRRYHYKVSDISVVMLEAEDQKDNG